MCKYITVSGSAGYKMRVIKKKTALFLPSSNICYSTAQKDNQMVSFFIKVILEKIRIPIQKMQRNKNIKISSFGRVYTLPYVIEHLL